MTNLSIFTIAPDTPVIEAMSIIDKNAKGIAFICKANVLMATLTDGDIRRYILRNGSLSTPSIEIANPNFKYATEDMDHNAIEQLFRTWEVRSIPILDSDGRLLRLHFPNEGIPMPPKAIDTPVVIMAGGIGTRLYPYTKVLPKPLIPIGDLTITELIMNQFKAFGCDSFTMIVNHKRNMIKAYFAETSLGYNVSFIDEEKPLGTGGGLKLLNGAIDRTFFLTNCDIIIFEDFEKILNYHRASQNLLTMVCATKQVVIPYGTVVMNEQGNISALSEKPSYSFLTNTGLYVIEPAFLRRIPDNTFIHITDIIQDCLNAGECIGVYPVSDEKWSDMGQMEEMEKMKKKLGV